MNLDAKVVWVVKATPQPLGPGKETGYPFLTRLGGPRAGMDECGKSSLHRGSIP